MRNREYVEKEMQECLKAANGHLENIHALQEEHKNSARGFCDAAFKKIVQENDAWGIEMEKYRVLAESLKEFG